LYKLASRLAGSSSIEQVRDVSTAFAKVHLHAHLSLITPASDETLQPLVVDQKFAHGADDTLQRAIQVVYHEHKPITSHQLSTTGCVLALLPLKGSTRSRGVLLLSPIDHNDHTLVTQGPLTEALASLIATSLERLHFVEVAHASQLETSAERLRSSILSALSYWPPYRLYCGPFW
jgi:two-component system sensor histidine kinase KdpD